VDIIKLNARPRSGAGKSYTRKVRITGWIPAIYYGHNTQPKTIEINGNEFTTLVRQKKTRSLFNLQGLTGEGGEAVAIIKEIQRDIIDRKKFLHIDFQRVAMDEKVTVDVPVELTGLPPIGVKEMGGVLQHSAKTIKVECLPANIPEKISVDVSMLKIGDSVHIRDINVANAVIKDSPDEVVAVVIQPTAEEVKAPEAAEGVEGVEGAAPGAEGAAAGGAEGAAAPGAEGAAAGEAGAPGGKGAPAAGAKAAGAGPGAKGAPAAGAKAAGAAPGADAKGKDAKGGKESRKK
jgi:large subunit ribosomal protein L25